VSGTGIYPWQQHDWQQLQQMRERLPHANLFHGTEGIGKVAFAAHFAASLLCERPVAAGHACGECDSCGWFAQYGHPDYRRVRPDALDGEDGDEPAEGEEGGKKSGKAPSKEIRIDQVRALATFMNVSTHRSGLRVVLLYPAEALKGVLLLVCHAPGRLIRTIRSRCRTLKLATLPEAVVADFVARRTEADPESALRLARMSGGAPGRAWALASEGALEMDDAARALVQGLPDLDRTLALSLTDRLRGGEGARTFALLTERLAARVHDLVLHRAGEGIGGLDAWAEAWSTLDRLPREVEALNLDRGEALLAALSDLRAAAEIVKGRHKADHVTAWVVPGSVRIKAEAEAEGLDSIFTEAGFEWREPGCSMCVGMNGDTGKPQQRIASTSNRNFIGRQGPGVRTHLVSPAMAVAAAVSGHFADVRKLA